MSVARAATVSPRERAERSRGSPGQPPLSPLLSKEGSWRRNRGTKPWHTNHAGAARVTPSAFAQGGLKLDEGVEGFLEGVPGLRLAQVVEHGDLLHAGDGAAGSARLARIELAAQVLTGVVQERNARVAALLGAVMNEAVFADVQVASAGAASPVVGPAAGDVFLEAVEAGVGALAHAHDIDEQALLPLAERLKLAAVRVQDTHRTREAELDGAPGHHQRVIRIAHRAAQNGVDVYL